MLRFQNRCMTCTMEYVMDMNINLSRDSGNGAGPLAGNTLHDFEMQCLRVLRCTAEAFATSPGGLRFKAGTRPWLDALSDRRPDISPVC